MRAVSRRAFLGAAVAFPVLAATSAAAQPSAVLVPAGQDRFGESNGLGISTIDIKVSPRDTAGGVLIIENTNRAKGGPAKHLHLDQDEHFYVLEGE